MHFLYPELCSHPLLSLPDFTKPFCIKSDASDTAVGGALTQEHTSVHKSIAFLTRVLASSEQNYNVYDYELLANISAPILMDNTL